MSTIEITQGSDENLVWTVENSGQPEALSGASVLSYSPLLEGRLSVLETDLPNGVVTLRVEGSDPLPLGSYKVRMQFVKSNGDTKGSPELTIRVV